ncbi:signal peptidase I [Clostridium sp.]|uniref:signal peptidase I n=1 Tax=Clostridium sp. TaxID=1506 RepID=UPI002A91D1C9|nr:signal peptidase I [Clostridium sp.]MDY6012046.1 signal peptidase I [Clostridium sp.]
MIEDQNNGKDDTKDNTVKKSAKSKKKIKETKKNFFFDWVIPIFISIVLAICINKFLIFKVYIPSSSMVPTLNVDDRLLVTRVYNPEKLQRGDIVVFDSDELNETVIKRLIGLPGDTIKIDGTAVYVNGKKLDEPYVEYPLESYGTYKVPEGKYFFLGDNRANSNDSRFWKDPYIDADKIQGKAQIKIYPLSQIGFLK